MELADWHMWWKRSGARELRQLLIEEWDPIHVRGVPEAADEYDTYLGQIASLLREGATVEDVAAFLNDVEGCRWVSGRLPLRGEGIRCSLLACVPGTKRR